MARRPVKPLPAGHVGSSPTPPTISECSAVWSACLIRIQEVVGSNPTTPTTNKVLVRGDAEGSSTHNGPVQTLANCYKDETIELLWRNWNLNCLLNSKICEFESRQQYTFIEAKTLKAKKEKRRTVRKFKIICFER